MHECFSASNRWWVSLIGIFTAVTLCGRIAIASDILSAIVGNRTEVAHKVTTLPDPGALFVAFSADSAKVVTAGFLDKLAVWTWQHGDATNHSLTMPAHSGLSRANIAVAFSRDGRY